MQATGYAGGHDLEVGTANQKFLGSSTRSSAIFLIFVFAALSNSTFPMLAHPTNNKKAIKKLPYFKLTL